MQVGFEPTTHKTSKYLLHTTLFIFLKEQKATIAFLNFSRAGFEPAMATKYLSFTASFNIFDEENNVKCFWTELLFHCWNWLDLNQRPFHISGMLYRSITLLRHSSIVLSKAKSDSGTGIRMRICTSSQYLLRPFPLIWAKYPVSTAFWHYFIFQRTMVTWVRFELTFSFEQYGCKYASLLYSVHCKLYPL